MTTNKLDRRVQRTRRALSKALIELILEKGYDAVRIQDIAERANLRAATLYLHYRNKEDLLLNTLETMFDDLVETLQSLQQDDVGETVHQEFKLVFRHVQDNKDLYRVIMGGQGSTAVRTRIRDYIAAQSAHRIRKRLEQLGASESSFPLSVDFVSTYVGGSLLALITQWLEDDGGHSAAMMGKISERLILRGIQSLLEPYDREGFPRL
ncbi:MAG: TetR/AcrR family transcriptional regulator [Anaerolineae bacterium]|nr:TetR/AcrR family transcriptional regulator [Anaerolineae bacterium]